MLNLTPAVVPSPSDGFVGLLRSDANIQYVSRFRRRWAGLYYL